ncbi:MAG: hypothetical protein AVDCRST_MAG52-614, partial [uncultured Blastococcus sp.]
ERHGSRRTRPRRRGSGTWWRGVSPRGSVVITRSHGLRCCRSQVL